MNIDKDYVNKLIEKLKNKVQDKKVLVGYSGRLDSVLLAKILQLAGIETKVVMIDNGLLRKNEVSEAIYNYKLIFNEDLEIIYAENDFLNLLKGITLPEQKRTIIGEEFIKIFSSLNKSNEYYYFAQGTIQSDIKESTKTKDGKFIKTHHNVGGLPKDFPFMELLEPLKKFYKPQIKEIAKILKLPKSIIRAQAFSGPGLSTRIIGEVTNEKLNLARESDYILRGIINKTKYKNILYQYFTVLIDTKSTGIKNNNRTYGNTIVLRLITSNNGLKAKFISLPYSLLNKISKNITSELCDVNRVVLDITSKPPSTIEWE
jgi:GMP synthase (glutamine-hydrolysing)